ncbi:phage major capsid protein [Planctomicrobium piriforme]|uniref:Phage major capsid protein, HK97 family n=1 Tax=Planctomicrobium piriforme TaxID=1576369 RepID=A0A1I3EDH9_9PLAN|nr:phage major capsid protein [Planctomicrobium piriforme]SFH97016.1 hypothetical protein SAMN05421753_104176 [Planctomicrobium piriforme]
MSQEWIGVINTTRPRFIKGFVDETIRSRLLLSMLRAKGRIEMNCSGETCKWQVKYSKPPVEAYGDGGVLDFANHDAYRRLEHDWRGYVATDALSMKQNAMNAGDEQLINLFQSKTNNLKESVQENFSAELFKDGEATGRENAVHGLETFLGAGTVTAADRIAAPSDTYGLSQLSTVAGNYGGGWSNGLTTSPNASLATDWPDGQGDPEYDFMMPKLINWSANSWGTGSTLWEDNCWRVISQAITWLTTTGGPDGMPDICLLGSNLFQGYKNHEEAIRRISIPHKAASDLGFAGNVLNQDGCAISADFDCPANTGYLLNVSQITLRSLMPELFWMKGPDEDARTAWSFLWGVGFWGNVCYRPKHVGKLFKYA